MKKSLIVYYSRKGENYWNGQIKDLAQGNTEVVAEMIAALTAGDLFEIETVKSYPANYTACTDEAKAELRAQARPALKRFPDHLDDYDTIFLGYPNWWGTMPMPVFTFLEHYDWHGKRILPFCTNEGSGMGASERDIQATCPGADVAAGLAIHGAEASASRSKVEAWVRKQVQA